VLGFSIVELQNPSKREVGVLQFIVVTLLSCCLH